MLYLASDNAFGMLGEGAHRKVVRFSAATRENEVLLRCVKTALQGLARIEKESARRLPLPMPARGVAVRYAQSFGHRTNDFRMGRGRGVMV